MLLGRRPFAREKSVDCLGQLATGSLWLDPSTNPSMRPRIGQAAVPVVHEESGVHTASKAWAPPAIHA